MGPGPIYSGGPAGIPLVAAELAADRASRSDPALIAVWEILEQVKDPEIPALSVRELGVLRALHLDVDGWRVVITPTYSGCPAMQAIADEIRAVLEGAGCSPVQIETRLSPAWSTDWIDAEARERLREYGIAPPVDADAHGAIACPRCGSEQVYRISEFGSTACKALYRCGDCAEPFDYFKRL